MLVESQPEAYAYKHINPETDLELLSVLTLDPNCIDEQWLIEIDGLMHDGSTPIRSTTTTAERNTILDARQRYEAKLGLRNPRHELHGPYLSMSSERTYGIVPLQAFVSLKELVAIGGNVKSAVGMVQDTPYLLVAGGKNSRLNYNHLGRVADRLGWQGDVNELALAEPEVLVVSRKKVTAIGSIAAEHGNPDQRNMDTKSIAQLVVRASAESHLLAIVRSGDEYVFGQRATPGSKKDGSARRIRAQQELLYKALELPENSAKIGHPVLHAYFNYRPPTADAQKKYPYLRDFIPLGRRVAAKPELSTKDIPRTITGDEPWLAEIPLPRRPQDRKTRINKLNRLIALGSEPLTKTGHGSADYEAILEARILFFRLLGWTKSGTAIGEAFGKFSLKREGLVSPQRVIEVMNLLSSYQVEPLEPVLVSNLNVFLYSNDTIRTKLEIIIEEGFTVNEILQVAGSILSYGQAGIRRVLQRRKRVRAAAAS